MNSTRLTGLGEPETTGKRSLFQPPDVLSESDRILPSIETIKRHAKKEKSIQKKPEVTKPRRARITTELTPAALRVIQAIQQEHRLKVGKVLPLWKAISQAIEYYGKSGEQ